MERPTADPEIATPTIRTSGCAHGLYFLIAILIMMVYTVDQSIAQLIIVIGLLIVAAIIRFAKKMLSSRPITPDGITFQNAQSDGGQGKLTTQPPVAEVRQPHALWDRQIDG